MTKPSFLLLLLLSFTGYAQIIVRNVVPVNLDEVPYPNLAGNTTSTHPHKGTVKLKDGSSVSGKITMFKKKDVFDRVKVNTGEEKKEIEAAQIESIVLDPKVYEIKHPNNYKNAEKNFQPGYILLANGVRLDGKVAQVRDLSDYDFFIYAVQFLPEGSTTASTFGNGKLTEFAQTIEGTTKTWDGYADGYLVRMVDGKYRLSRNPYSKTKNEFFTSLKNQATDSLAKDAAKRALVKSLKDGNNVNESIENASNAGAVVGETLGQIEINKKEYLIFNVSTGAVTVFNKDKFKTQAASFAANCPAALSVSQWDTIDAYVKALNACP
jgi:hypothetical protein